MGTGLEADKAFLGELLELMEALGIEEHDSQKRTGSKKQKRSIRYTLRAIPLSEMEEESSSDRDDSYSDLIEFDADDEGAFDRYK